MHDTPATTWHSGVRVAILALLASAYQARATDTYGPGAGELQIPAVRIGTGTYSDVTLTVGSIVTAPHGTWAIGHEDTYDPPTNELTVPAVNAGSATLYNAVGSVTSLGSIGGVAGADTFDGVHLHLPYVLVGSSPYYNVVLNVSLRNVAAVHGGMPRITWDEYSLSGGQLSIPGVLVGTTVYTNVVLNVGLSDVVSAGTSESVLHGLGGAGDGVQAYDSLVQAGDGNFYGMTPVGGANNKGAVIKVTPAGTETVLYSFSGSGGDGEYPYGSLIQASDGNLYGMTYGGGANGVGAIIKITMPAGIESVLYSLKSVGGDGQGPHGSLVEAHDGNFYGLTYQGGAVGAGAVIKVTPAGDESVIYSFNSVARDGTLPYGSLIEGTDGNLYGMTYGGGQNGYGTLIEVTLDGVETVLWSLGSQSSDGASPGGSLIQASDGNFYGTTYNGGTNNNGTVIRYTPAGVETVLHSFGSGADGAFPRGSLIQASDGNLYGLTEEGGTYGYGSIFKVTLPGDSESLVYSFRAGADGKAPRGSLIQALDANLYGMTQQGGANGTGVVFKIAW